MRSHYGEPVHKTCATAWITTHPTEARLERFASAVQPNQELVDFTQGVYAAREMALARVNEQANAMGAGGMVGMRIDHDIDIREVDNGGKREDLIVTFHILGTAIAPSGEHREIEPKPILRRASWPN